MDEVKDPESNPDCPIEGELIKTVVYNRAGLGSGYTGLGWVCSRCLMEFGLLSSTA